MFVRIALLVVLLGSAGVALDGAPSLPDLPVGEDVAADTCDGWPQPIPKLLDGCPHGPTP